MSRALLAAALAAALPVAAQFAPPAVPNGLAPLPKDKAACNTDGTHCLVNKADLSNLLKERVSAELVANIAGELLAEKDRQLASKQAEIDELLRRIKAMRPRCATVEKVPAPSARKL